jgi:hypothetical protein
MRWIGVESCDDITPRESEQTSIRSLITRELEQPTKETKQMTAVATPAGAVPHGEVDWHAVDWRSVNVNVRRLQARIVKATQGKRWGRVKAAATPPDPLVFRQSPVRQTSDRKLR